MRTVIQRVSEASVEIDGKIRGKIERGFLVLAGIERTDTRDDADWIVKKLPALRAFEDDAGNMNRSLMEVGGEILLISQFTLFGNMKKGNRPSFNRAASPELAKPLYEYTIRALALATGRAPATGEFGAIMRVALVNEGPVTILLDSRNRSG